jgi:RecA/RadA recombinase
MEDFSKLQKILNFKENELINFLHDISIFYLQNDIISTKELEKNEILGLGCDVLNQYLKGGIKTKLLIELSGESSTGKTNLCLQLLIQAFLSKENKGLDGKSIYITTNEEKFHVERLKEISGPFLKKDKKNYQSLTDSINQKHIYSLEEFEICIFKEIPILLEKVKNIRLLIIDSIGSIFRTEYKENEFAERSNLLFRLSSHLKTLSTHYNMVIIIVNQMSSIFENENTDFDDDSTSLSTMEMYIKRNRLKKLTPTLGLSWSHCIDMRVVLSRSEISKKKNFNIVFSPYMEDINFEYDINENGLFGVE